MKILLIAGGWSSEREVSLNGAKAIAEVLLSGGHKVTFLDPASDFDGIARAAGRHDFAFVNLHGQPGEDGLIQAILDRAGCPYQGSGPAGSLLALNKAAAKQLFRYNGLPTPDWEFLPQRPGADWRPRLPFPLFVKSNTGGSSLRLGRANDMAELWNRLDEIFAAAEGALVERALTGRELTCAVLGHEALPPVLIEPAESDYFDYRAKYDANGAREICPAPLDGPEDAEIRRLALEAHRVLGLSGVSRSDFIQEPGGRLSLLEVNTLPGMTGTSLVPKEARAAGFSFLEFLERLMALGMAERSRQEPGQN